MPMDKGVDVTEELIQWHDLLFQSQSMQVSSGNKIQFPKAFTVSHRYKRIDAEMISNSISYTRQENMSIITSILAIGVLVAAVDSAVCSSNGSASVKEIDSAKRKYCGEVAYDKDISVCCNGAVSSRPRCTSDIDQGCCGSAGYDKSRFQCCQGVVGLRHGPREHNKCCGTVSFDNSTHMCCKGAVNPRPDGDHSDHKCCRAEAFNRRYDQCKDGIVMVRATTQ
ncbi:hypothetical protein CAPTEDRAFT_189164 [Capitella teleta]|uniref:Galaxin-like repeats domain-containing protein n=1 Tax=Capitella teleta TaxID=283909 RepID=R7UPY4_CAPTE|nr:hypothetical protein CAPTEDRAFT_189164 [Capitella teleta]|eukprot:ELU08260.1 hypothetical protein CAPTEDRAFT_189164 [Capitella teleta]